MKKMRVFGSAVRKLADERKMGPDELGRVVSCTPQQIARLYEGRLLLAFDQLSAIADALRVSAIDLIRGDEEHYQKTAVHCMGAFSNEDAREEILDIIDDYLDLRECAK